MKRIMIAPSNYVQGSGELRHLAEYVKQLGGSKAYIITGPHVVKVHKDDIEYSFKQSGAPFHLEVYCGECCDEEIDRLVADLSGADVVVAVGGGKVIDTAKAVGYKADIPVIVAPTAASSDAPCSRLSVIYNKDGSFNRYLFLRHNPDMVLMDLDVIVNSPARQFASGMGDAMATYYEAMVSVRSGSKVMSGAYTSKTAIAIAKLCRDILLADGYRALKSMEKHAICEAFENVVEANTYLSGLGFENGGLGAAHSVHNGLTALEETHKLLHGEKVAFGVVCQLILDNYPVEETDMIINFLKSVGLPVCFKDLGIDGVSDAQLMKVAELTAAEGETIHCQYQEITPAVVFNVMKAADAYVNAM